MRKLLAISALLLLPLTAEAQFNRNLYFGLRNDPEVTKLQNFLRDRGFFLLSPTGNFFGETQKAVKKFQQALGISPVSGYFGPLSRAAANKVLVGSGSPATASPSSFKNKIAVSASPYSDDPRFESITLENISENQKIIITGFSIENYQNVRFVIPKGHELPGFAALPEDPITLNPGDRAFISVGKQEKQMDFRMNACVGYFEEFSTFEPSISSNCPTPDTTKLMHLSDECISIVENTAMCRTAELSLTINSACSTYINNTLNYSGCVRLYKSSAGFYGNEWRIWMQRSSEFLRNTHDKIILRDQLGRVVAEYSY